jgi:hypothetical protein
MASCHEMKKDEIYTCPDCGLELKVVAVCKDAGQGDGCECSEDDHDHCSIACCGKPLVKK